MTTFLTRIHRALEHAKTELRTTPINRLRVAGMSVTMAAHVALILLLMIPSTPSISEPKSEEKAVQVVFLPHVGRDFRPAPPTKPPSKKKVERTAKTPPLKKPDPLPPTPVVEHSTLPIAAEEVLESKNLEAVLAVEEEMSELDLPPADYPPSEILSYRSAYQPAYPEEARLAGESGWVVLKVLVDAEGWPLTFVLVKNSATDRLALAAIEAVKKWKFNPAMMRDGTKVPAWVEVPIGFFNSRAEEMSQANAAPVTTHALTAR